MRAITAVGLAGALALGGGARLADTPAAAAQDGPAGEGWFTDEAEAAGLDMVHVNGMSGDYYIAEIIGSGLAMVDVDNDGDLDLFLAQGRLLGPDATSDPTRVPHTTAPSLGDRLFRNDLVVHADGSRTLRFTDVTAASGLTAGAYTMGVATGDVDNDGWVDLYLTRLGPDQLLHNDGDGTFTDVSRHSDLDHDRWSVSASFLDYDRDGWLDLYVGHYLDEGVTIHRDCSTPAGERNYCGPERYPPVPDRLYRNRGDGTLADVTAESGVARAYGPALGVVAADLDGDQWVDLYVANDGRDNQLWINQRDGTFRDGALTAGVALNADGRAEAGMGVDAGDFDDDGDEDLFVTHLASETNTLYVNDGTGLFDDRSAGSGLGAPSLPYTGFGTLWFDFDNDGWLDLLAVNGAVGILQPLTRAGDPHPLHQRNLLFRNLGNGRFEEVSGRAGAVFTLSEVSRGAAFGDLDNDGDLDVVVSNNNGRARLLLNQVGNRKHWIGLRLLGASAPRDMLGARVGIFVDDGRVRWRRARTDGGYASAHDPRVLVGLGDVSAVVRVRVVWPSGQIEEWTDLGVDQWFTLTEGTGRPVR